MFKHRHLKKLVLALGLIALSGAAQAQFDAGMNKQQLATETTAQLNAGTGLAVAAKQAIEAGMNPASVTEALIMAGQDAISVVKIMIGVDPLAAASITAAAVAAAPSQVVAIMNAAIVAAPLQSKSIVAAVLTVPGVNPADVVAVAPPGGASVSQTQPRLAPRSRFTPRPTLSPASSGRGSASPS
ncbi:MAG: hypothetical protein HOO95_07070 [Gallionella sp.]|nr:hypothetical protein [Gallionella sp.]